MNERTRYRWIIALATLGGAILRLWNLPRLGIDHFDEGIYAIAGLWALNPKGLAAYDPGTVAYAPPGYPILVGLSYLIFGVRDTAAILVSIVAGIATIPVVAWLAKRTFGAGAGAAAAWLCALNGPHVAFSRTGLTDSLALLTFLVALGFGMRFLERPGFWRAVVFGVMVGLAQNVKYSGFLSGVIVGLAWAIGLFHVEHRARGPLLRTLCFGILAAIVAPLCYLPWFLFVERTTGYAGLLAHQRGYVSGIESWFSHWQQQMAQSVALSGLLSGEITWAGPAWGLAIFAGACAAGSLRRGDWMRVVILSLSAFGLAGLLPVLGWWVALALVMERLWGWTRGTGFARIDASEIRPPHPNPVPRGEREPEFASRLLFAAWMLMSLLTPFYYAYARLWLPVEALSWLIVGSGLVRVTAAVCRAPLGLSPSIAWLRQHAFPATTTIAVICASWMPTRDAVVWPWLLGPTDGLREATRKLTTTIQKRDPGARPALMALPPTFFYFTTQGLRVRRVDKLEALLASKDWQIADELQARILSGFDRFQSEMVFWQNVRYEVSGSTLFDVEPSAVYGTSSLGEGQSEWIAPHALLVRPKALIRISPGPAASYRITPRTPPTD